ncbi:MAG: hypothetical protein ACR2LL_04880 [Nitrosopumilus sp.]|uniref:hypothetical protein n=1 Tax=Nitrosopumilus sp. TaxID=2024843 RepID=UPI002930B155|nr:hypothetical protein [Nitrosopumilus sp.]
MGINFVDTIVVRRVSNRGTTSEEVSIKPVDYMGDENKKKNLDRLKLAGDMWIMSARGTSKIHLSEMREAKPVDIKGYYISTGKGTGRIKI